MNYQLFNLKNVSWKHYPLSQPRVTLSARLSYILTMGFLSQLTTYHPTFPTIHTQPNQLYTFEDNAAVIQMINKRRSPQPKSSSQERTESIWIGCLKE